MGDRTGIEWTDATWNPVSGCSKVSQGCKHCYAERVFPRPYPGRAFTDVRFHLERLHQPLRWKRPRRIFVNSMSDLFHGDVPDWFICRVFQVMALATQHIFQILTKRPDRMLEYISHAEIDIRDVIKYEPAAEAMRWPLPNVWLGVSVEDQATADERVPLLLETPAAVHWISAEPLLEQVSLLRWLPLDSCAPSKRGIGIDWVVVGGESGPKARPMHPNWALSLRDQCTVAGVPFLFKQWGEHIPASHDDCPLGGPARDWVWSDGSFWYNTKAQREGLALMRRVGKKRAGRLLDGQLYDDYP